MKLQDPLASVRGIGGQLVKKYAILGIENVGQLLYDFPRRYEDYSQITPTNQLRPGPVTIEAVVKEVKGHYVRRGLHITEAVASDELGSVRLVWFNQPYRATAIRAHQSYYISGTYELSYRRFAIMNPSIELKSDFPLNTARIRSVYRETKGLTSRQIRSHIQKLMPEIDNLPETLPKWLIESVHLLDQRTAVRAIHFPEDMTQLEQARRRLGFDEVFSLTLAGLMNKAQNHREVGIRIPFQLDLAQRFVAELPFRLTDDQRRACWQIFQDFERAEPMNRLIEGDVGSGKTVVAAMAALMAMSEGWQVAFMAPTELLARQHAETLYNLLTPHHSADKVLLLVGSLTAAKKTKAQTAIAEGRARLIVGTHALISQKVVMPKLAFVIIDEQHRFGVAQRTALQAKAGRMPHILSLSATPIPRSLALTLYGELDISRLTEKPAGRQEIKTELVSPNSRRLMHQKIEQEIARGRQVYVVCPSISEGILKPSSSAEQVYERLKNQDFKGFRIALLHGRMTPPDKQSIMQQFVEGAIDILVSTTVIEVGVDVPNASVMVIEDAERFGLAQLHQLRGRVGRRDEAGYCFYVLGDSAAPSRRLRALETISDGFRLAEIDLKLRGPGAIYGAMQHGQLDLRIAELSDRALISAARRGGKEFLDRHENLLQYPMLSERVNRLRVITNLN